MSFTNYELFIHDLFIKFNVIWQGFTPCANSNLVAGTYNLENLGKFCQIYAFRGIQEHFMGATCYVNLFVWGLTGRAALIFCCIIIFCSRCLYPEGYFVDKVHWGWSAGRRLYFFSKVFFYLLCGNAIRLTTHKKCVFRSVCRKKQPQALYYRAWTK